MAREKVDPLHQIFGHIRNGDNFVLNGGAGSGKTTSLVDVLDHLYRTYPKFRVACITYTNVAADEISERWSAKGNFLRASTIHDFLWATIKGYQKNLKSALLELLTEGRISLKDEAEIDDHVFQQTSIEYREWKKIEEGIISHNEVLLLANRMFEKYPLLRKILSDSYGVILIDEYQDTEQQVIEIFLDYFQDDTKAPLIGLFGDAMQSIYDKGIGDVRKYIDGGLIKETQKEDNWRCSTSVIELINKIRNDGLVQQPTGDNVKGSISFLYSTNENIDISTIKQHAVFDNFNFNDHENNKELYLTHKLIARQFGFFDLLTNYKYNDNVVGDKPDKLIKHLLRIQELMSLYNDKAYNELIKRTDFSIGTNNDLQALKNGMDKLKSVQATSIEVAIDIAHNLGLVICDDALDHFKSKYEDQYEKVRHLPFAEIANLYQYKNQFTFYSTQHGVKGAEFDNVFVVLDNGRWNKYNFKHLFENTKGKQSIIEKTRKIFYVCCSRAKQNLVVYYPNPSQEVLGQAAIWFEQIHLLK